jgi:hypothetical protein
MASSKFGPRGVFFGAHGLDTVTNAIKAKYQSRRMTRRRSQMKHLYHRRLSEYQHSMLALYHRKHQAAGQENETSITDCIQFETTRSKYKTSLE